MSAAQLLQLGSKLWLRPIDVVGVRWVEPRMAIGSPGGNYYSPPKPGHVVIEREQDSGGYSMLGSGKTIVTEPSDWSVERVRDALGLPNSEPIRKLWEDTAE